MVEAEGALGLSENQKTTELALLRPRLSRCIQQLNRIFPKKNKSEPGSRRSQLNSLFLGPPGSSSVPCTLTEIYSL